MSNDVQKCTRCNTYHMGGPCSPIDLPVCKDCGKPSPATAGLPVSLWCKCVKRAPTNPPSVPSLDVEACVRLLDDLILMLAPHDAQSIADADQLRALKAALAGMGKDSERIDWFEVNAFNAGFHDGACEVLDADGNEWRAKTFREAVDRAAQPEETSADEV